MSWIKRLFRRDKKRKNHYGWFGNFQSWAEAKAGASGYETSTILEKTKNSLLKVKNGEAVYERDSVLFDKKEYPYAVISALLYIAIKNENKLHVIDFGGSLGSTWFQIRDFMPAQIELYWSIVEQPAYVQEGKTHFSDEVLDFYFSLDECIAARKKPDVVLLSGVLQYLEKPHDFLDQLSKFNVDYIVFDRTAFLKDNHEDRLTLQRVPPEIYDAQYPSWFFNEQDFLKHFPNYTIKADFEPFVAGEQTMFIDHKPIAYDKGFLFERIKESIPPDL